MKALLETAPPRLFGSKVVELRSEYVTKHLRATICTVEH